MKKNIFFPVSPLVAVCLFLCIPVEAIGAEAETPQKDSIEILNQALHERDRIIQDLLKRMEILERGIQALRESAPQRNSSSTPPAPLPPHDPEEIEEEERMARAGLERILIQRSALLLPPWTVEIEPSFTYSHSSSDRINIDGVTMITDLPGVGFVFGEIVNERRRRDTLIPALAGRLGLPYDFQAEVRVPYSYESQRVLRADFQETYDRRSGLGDIELSLTHQVLQENGWLPDLLGTARWRIPTGKSDGDLPLGTGFHGIQGLLTAVKFKDPLAFFGSLSYTANLPDHKQNILINPGDTWGVSVGAALALTPESSLNISWEQQFTDRTKIAGEKVPGSALTLGSLRFGFTHALTQSMAFDFGVAVGLTRDAPDMQATTALPIRYPSLLAQ